MIQHGSGNVGDIAASITFASHVDLEIGDAKGHLKVLEKFDEILGDVLLGRSSDFANGETGTNGLLNPVI